MAEGKKKDPTKVQLKNVRLSFAQSLYRAKPFGGDGDGEPNHSSNFLIDPNTREGKVNIEKMEDAIDHVLKSDVWKGKPPKLPESKMPLRDGNNHDYDGYEDMMYVSASNKKKPRILDADKLDVSEGDDGAPYSGCMVDAIVRVWGQNNKWGKRINASLEGVRFRDDGDAFGAAPLDPDEFDDDDDDRGSRRSSSKRGRDDDDDRGSRRGGSSRSREEDDGEDDRRSSSRRRGRDEDEKEERSSRRGRDRDDEEGDDRRSSRSRSRSRDDDEGKDEDRSSRSRGRSRDEDEDEGDDRRSGRSRGRSRDEDDEGDERRSSRSRGRSKGDDEDEDRGERRSSRRRGRRDDDDLA